MGMAAATISELRTLRRNRSSTTKVMPMPNRPVDERLPSDRLMKSAWLKMILKSKSAAAERSSCGSASITASAARTVLAPDCLRTSIHTSWLVVDLQDSCALVEVVLDLRHFLEANRHRATLGVFHADYDFTNFFDGLILALRLDREVQTALLHRTARYLRVLSVGRANHTVDVQTEGRELRGLELHVDLALQTARYLS